MDHLADSSESLSLQGSVSSDTRRETMRKQKHCSFYQQEQCLNMTKDFIVTVIFYEIFCS